MIGVEECVGDDLPCSAPQEFLIIDEDPHKFRNGKCWVRLRQISCEIIGRGRVCKMEYHIV